MRLSAHLRRLPKLRHLNLDYTNVSDKGVAELSTARPELEWLRLDSGNITDAAIDSLAKLKALKHLNLYHTLVTEAGVARLKAALPDAQIIYDRDSSLPNRRRS